MAPPTAEQIFGPLTPIPSSQLVDDAKVYQLLSAPGSPFEVEDRLIDGRLQTVYKQLPASLRDFWHSSAALTYGHRDYLVFDEQRFTFRQMYDQSVSVARWLQRRFQVRKGDRVGIVSRNYPEFVSTFWATHMLGAVAAVLNSFHDGETLAYSIHDVGCRVVVCDGERYERLFATNDARAHLVDVNGFVVMPWIGVRRVENEKEKTWSASSENSKMHDKRVFDWQTLTEQETHRVSSEENENQTSLLELSICPEDNACILFTSGTTGRPKGVLSTQRQFLSCLRLASFGAARALIRRNRPLPPPPDTSSSEQSSILLLVPLAHTTGLQSGLLNVTALGNKLVMMPTYHRDKAIQLAQVERVRGILGIGFMVREIVLSGAKLPDVQQFGHGGSSSAKELPRETASHHAHTVLSSGYGLTEVNGVAAANMMDDYHARPTSAGKPPTGVSLMLVDPESNVAIDLPDKVGELWIRTPGRAKGYWNRPKESAEAFLADGWFRSGDLATMDKDGFIYIVDRVKDIIVRGGENVSCTHVESALYAHRDIADCAAVALPDERLGERVGVVCVIKENVERLPTNEDVEKVAVIGLPKHCVPEFIWVRREPLPRNANGKILRNQVKKEALDEAKRRNWQPRQTSSGKRASAKL